MHFDRETKEMCLKGIFLEVAIEEIKDNVGWDLKISEDLLETEPRTRGEMTLLREK